MAFFDTTWYCNAGDQSTTGYYAVAKRPQNTAVVAGQLVRQFTAPAVGSERVFVCGVAGTTANTTDATWVITRGNPTTDGTVTWYECTGQAALNGDLANTPSWAAIKAVGGNPGQGQIIKRNNGASYQFCRVGGTVGASEPAFSDTAGAITADSSVSWVSLGPVGNFTGGQAPHARLANACATNWFAAGNTIYVGDNHAESQATVITISPAGSTSLIGRIICHNRSGSYPPASSDLTTGATISTTGAFNINFTPTAGGYYFYGLTLIAGVGQSAASSVQFSAGGSWIFCDRCSFQIATTFSAATVNLASGGQPDTTVFNNTTVKFANTGQNLNISGQFIWQNTGAVLVSGSLVPVNLVANAPNMTTNAVLEALDLSQLTSAINSAGGTTQQGQLLVKDCKLNAATTVATPSAYGSTIQLVRCDSGATGYKSARYQYEGTETTEISITRVGGAADPTGQAQSRKIVTTANVQWLRPFRAEPYAIWNPATGANVTVTVCGTVNAGALPNNDDIWMEVEYLGSSATPFGSIVTTTKSSVLATGSAVASDSSVWGNPVTTFDPASLSNTALSNGNLTVTHSNATASAGARVAVSAAVSFGKYYFEITNVLGSGSDTSAMGLLTTAGAYTDFSLGTAAAIIVQRNGGLLKANSVASSALLGTFVAGDVLGIAVDFNANLIWARRNNNAWNVGIAGANPVTGVGGVTFTAGSYSPAATFSGAAGDQYTANFGATSYANAAPSGFLNWGTGVPFKLVATLSSPQPGMAGYIHVRVRAAKPSTTYYIDPQITLS